MANQEGEVEFPQHVPRDDGGVFGLGIRVIRIRSLDGTVCGTIDAGAGCSNAALLSLQGRCNGWRISVGRDQVIDHVLYKNTLALREGK